MGKKILIIGSGGREHALVWKLKESPRVGKIYVAPGNGGTRKIAENVQVSVTDIDGLLRFAESHAIDLVVVGPEDPLALGVVDAFRSCGFNIFGPTRAAAEIETSKAFAKELMRDAGIPTAPFRIFGDYKEALAHVREHGTPIVVKASGPALGKGAYPCRTIEQAEAALGKIMVQRIHGAAGDNVVVEKFLDGQEISIHTISDGVSSLILPPAQDHKRVGDGDTGDNTGGMGTIAPVPWVDEGMLRSIDARIVHPVLNALAAAGRPFTGCLFPGIMITEDGPAALEINARFGDPETQVLMRLLKTDLLDVLEACTNGTLANLKLEWHSGFAVCVVLASGGYPGAYRISFPIEGISDAESIPGIRVFHAGTTFGKDRILRTSGGRVLGVTAMGDTLQDAIKDVYEAARLIKFHGMHCRKDIGTEALTTWS